MYGMKSISVIKMLPTGQLLHAGKLYEFVSNLTEQLMMITITFCMINSRCSIMSLGTRSSRRQLSYEDEAVTSSASDTRGQVTIHSCALCKVQHEHMSYVQTWKSVEACKLVAEKGITPKNLICRPCRDDVCRMVGNPDYVPRWEKRKERVKCCIKDCTEVSHVFSNIATVEKIVANF